VNRAICNFEPTNLNAGPLSGYIQFEYDSNYNVATRMWVQGLSPGEHMFHVHTYGDISAPDGEATKGHFQGSPVTGRLEVGALGGPAYRLTADANGFASAYLVDPEVKLSGKNSIIGRSVVIHGNAGSTEAKVAQCVVGIMMEDEKLPLSNTTHGTVPLVTQASAVITPASAGPAKLKGQVEIFQQESNDARSKYGARLRYIVSGLMPHAVHNWAITQFGDVTAVDASLTGSTFKGCANRTSAIAESEVGAIGKLYPMTADANGVAHGEIVDRFMSLNGLSSVIGRTMVVYGNASNPVESTKVYGMGVIGRTKEIAVVKAMPPAVATNAVCRLQPTRKGPSALTGTISFAQATPSDAVTVTYNINGFSATGNYPWHVHQWGDLIGLDDALSTSGHFIGSHFLRPMCTLQEVGNINNGAPLVVSATGSAITGTFTDGVLELSGSNSIIGRSIVIHDAAVNANRIAYCVIGVKAETAVDPEACLNEPSFINPVDPEEDDDNDGGNPGGIQCPDGTIRQTCPAPPAQESSSDDVPLIVGLVVGLGGGLLVIGAGVFFFMKSRGATLNRSKEIAGAEMHAI